MDTTDPGSAPPTESNLTWANVAIASSFIVLDVLTSRVLGLGIGALLATSAVRCVVQLALVAVILQTVFEAENGWAIVGIVFLLNFLGTVEAVVNRSKRRYKYMFAIVLLGMLSSTLPITIIGVRYAMSTQPFWKPNQFIPLVGMLAGNAVSGIVVATSFVLREMQENRDKIETYLAFGASRFEACRPIATEALRLALMPIISSMSVIGIVAIPGTMTGAILGGASVTQAARLQTVIMYMISSSVALATIATTVCALAVVVDADARVREERIDGRVHGVWRGRDWVVARGRVWVWRVWEARRWGWRGPREKGYVLAASKEDQENGILLGSPSLSSSSSRRE